MSYVYFYVEMVLVFLKHNHLTNEKFCKISNINIDDFRELLNTGRTTEEIADKVFDTIVTYKKNNKQKNINKNY